MAEKSEIIGSGKTRHDNWLQITLSEKTLRALLDDLDSFEGHKYVKLNINIGAKDQYGKDIKVTRDRYKFERKMQEPIPAEYTREQNQRANDNSESVDLPF